MKGSPACCSASTRAIAASISSAAERESASDHVRQIRDVSRREPRRAPGCRKTGLSAAAAPGGPDGRADGVSSNSTLCRAPPRRAGPPPQPVSFGVTHLSIGEPARTTGEGGASPVRPAAGDAARRRARGAGQARRSVGPGPSRVAISAVEAPRRRRSSPRPRSRHCSGAARSPPRELARRRPGRDMAAMWPLQRGLGTPGQADRGAPAFRPGRAGPAQGGV